MRNHHVQCGFVALLLLSLLSVRSAEVALSAPAATTSGDAAVGSAVADTNASGSKIGVDALVHDFGPSVAGSYVKHTYYFTNTGDSLLILTNVHTSCGCTTAGEWSRQVEPGQFVSIPIQFRGGTAAGPVAKTITINCYDMTQPVV